MSALSSGKRVVSGMRASGRLHLGHYHGVLKNWVALQEEFECYFFVADWHGLTTHYDEPGFIGNILWDMVIDWLACGIDPEKCTLFIQSWVPEQAELHLLLSMITPNSWLERVPTYKDQQEKLHDKDLSTYGFLGYPLLQSADVLLYKGDYVPVGQDQVSHIELVREVARRFNHLYGQEVDSAARIDDAIKKMGKKEGKIYQQLRIDFQQNGDKDALHQAQALVLAQANLAKADKARLIGYLEGTGKIILPEPEAYLTAVSKMPGTDGRKMSKSYGNTIALRDEAGVVEKKILTMPTDPARVKRTDVGCPTKCPVWELHGVYSSDAVKSWVDTGCRTAAIGCIDCKRPVIQAINEELKPIQANIKSLEANKELVKEWVTAGSRAARESARKTLKEVRDVMGLNYEHNQS